MVLTFAYITHHLSIPNRTAGKNYPPQVKKQLGTANTLYVQNKVNEALDVLSEVIRTCPQVSPCI